MIELTEEEAAYVRTLLDEFLEEFGMSNFVGELLPESSYVLNENYVGNKLIAKLGGKLDTYEGEIKWPEPYDPEALKQAGWTPMSHPHRPDDLF